MLAYTIFCRDLLLLSFALWHSPLILTIDKGLRLLLQLRPRNKVTIIVSTLVFICNSIPQSFIINWYSSALFKPFKREIPVFMYSARLINNDNK